MTVEIAEVPGPAYAWDSAGFAWTAVEGAKTWGSARVAAWEVAAGESLPLSRTEARRPGLRAASAFALADALLRHANAVVADLAVRSTPLDEAGFRALIEAKGPLGYGPFRELVAGDYDYARAVIGLRLRAPITAERAAIAEAIVNADVPDVRGRGTASIPAGGTTVAFNRSFTAPPEVQVTLKAGGALALPEVLAITETGFDVRLVDAADGTTPVAGTVSWSALGY